MNMHTNTVIEVERSEECLKKKDVGKCDDGNNCKSVLCVIGVSLFEKQSND